MKLRMFLSALFKLRNIGSLLVLLGIWTLLNARMLPVDKMLVLPACFIPYLILVTQSLASKGFHEEFNHREKIRRIQDLNYSCLRLSSEAKRHLNPTYVQKLRKVVEDKNDIVNSFFRGERNFLKERIVEQTLNLVVSYIKLLANYSLRSKELNSMDLGEIANRINMNNRKLGFIKDVHTADDLKKVIEMDEKIINRLKDEKKELERISTKLDYMESTVNMFKHQILSSVESEEMLEKLETAVNEATALDNVLEDRRKKMRL